MSSFQFVTVCHSFSHIIANAVGDNTVILNNAYGLTTLNKPKSREVSTNNGIITQNIFNAAVPTSIETK